MGGILIRVLSWLGTTGLGWMISDGYNEYQRSKQANPNAKVSEILANTAKNNWIKWVAIVVVAVVVILIFKPKNQK